jgi:hypothetical protein
LHTILHKELEHLRILVSAGILEQSSKDTEGCLCILFLIKESAAVTAEGHKSLKKETIFIPSGN